ncbi:twin-arginine translocation pathway signal protein [Curtobacterium sp. 'Ferrero']|uniref:FAD-binding oxidoreductase n=1 Tax=Curtobacterium sp. 'Ferrero' TaxID=2033654 RepID=UPI000BD9C9B8|nr:FAD-binding protein [Curtobacterium sp. 'Ferrero']PCN47280.1 twin-arginine translocation pathway signal protein [Curtobacterium sp. 'Ferrero']
MTGDRTQHTPTRRALIGGGVGLGIAGLLAACSGGGPAPTRSPSSTAGSAPPDGATPTSTAAGPTTWQALAATVSGRLLRPGSEGWDDARVLQNPRYDDADPRGILLATSDSDVQAGLAFARNSDTPLALRAGGHSYTGWSAGGAPGTDVPPSLVISTKDLDGIAVHEDGTATIGPGATLGDVYATLAAKGRAIGSGSCPTVGIGGLTLGGGVGVLSRSFGLTCDQLTAVRIVTPDGTVHDVSEHDEPDLFWACRGGGGGTVGVVTALTFRTRTAPGVLLFDLAFPWSSAADVVRAWQDWAPSADDELWSTLKLLNGSRHSRPAVTVTGVWTGSKTGADASVDAFIAATGATPIRHTAEQMSYGAAMDALAGKPQRVSEAATSSIGGTKLTDGQIDTLVQHAAAAGDVSGNLEGGVSLDALGGAVARVGRTDTAFPWRSALMTAQYTAVFRDGADPEPFDAYVRGFRAAMEPAWGSAAYANYCDAAITDPTAYFGVNTSRLHRIAEQVDPDGLLSQPHWV